MLANYNIENPCKKQTVKAVLITMSGDVAYGSNSIRNVVNKCPRVVKKYKTGEGYHLCKEVCNQNEHAEIMAIRDAKEKGYNLFNSKIYIVGHTYFCDNCTNEMIKNQISGVYSYNSEFLVEFDSCNAVYVTDI